MTREEIERLVEVKVKESRIVEKSPGSTTNARFFTTYVQEHTQILPFETFGFDLNSVTAPAQFCPTKTIPGHLELEEVYQQYFVQEVAKSNIGFPNLVGLDTHNTPYLNGRKPDFSFFPPPTTTQTPIPTAVDVVTFGEIKTRKSGNEIGNNSSLGEVITFSHEAILNSPNRTFCYSFITNCEDIIFIKTIYDPSGYSYIITPKYNMQKEGGLFLNVLLTTEYNKLGWKPIFQTNSGSYKVTEKVGSGATSTVWRSGEHVIKHYAPTFRDVIDSEASFLNLLDFDGVPKVVSKGQDFLVLKPFGKSVERGKLTQKQLRSLVNILRNAHKKGVVHRDIRWSNLIIDQKGEVVLIDWGFAAKSNIPNHYKGSVEYAASDILQNLLLGVPSITSLPKHDLHMLSRMIYHQKIGDPENTFQAAVEHEGPNALIKYWTTAFSSGIWKTIYQYCETLDYDNLANSLSDLFSF
jgi:hypothetical protein